MSRAADASLFRKLRSGHTLLLIAGGLLLLLVLVPAFLHHREKLRRTNALADRLIAQTAQQFERISLLTQREKRLLRKFKNPTHVNRAELLGVERLKKRAAIHELVEAGRLVSLESNDYYMLQPMSYSVPAVTPSMTHLLTLLGMRFQAALRRDSLPFYRFVITSGTRTRRDQAALRRVNANAAGTSSHEFGTTVDLHYARFALPENPLVLPDTAGTMYSYLLERKLRTAFRQFAETRPSKLKAVLGRALLRLQQEESKVMVIYERRQPVYHITVARDIDPPATDSIGPASPPVDSTTLSTSP